MKITNWSPDPTLRVPVTALLLFSDPNQKLLARGLLEYVLYTGELRVELSAWGRGGLVCASKEAGN